MLKVLLTGGTGFLGNTILSCINKTCLVSTLSRSKGDYQISLEKEIPKFTTQFDIVIHAAGKAHSYSNSKTKINEYYDINVIGTQNLLNGLTQAGVPKYLVFISSVSVYGRDFGNGINENSHLGATDKFGISKIDAERLVFDWCRRFNVICTILRLPLIVGENPPGNLGSMIQGIQKGYYLNIAGGKAKKSMVLAEDVAKFILKAASIGGVYNLTDGYHPSFAEFSECISINLRKGKPKQIPMWLARIVAILGDFMGSNAILNSSKLKKIATNLTYDDTKAREAFGWDPTPVLEGFKISYK